MLPLLNVQIGQIDIFILVCGFLYHISHRGECHHRLLRFLSKDIACLDRVSVLAAVVLCDAWLLDPMVLFRFKW